MHAPVRVQRGERSRLLPVLVTAPLLLAFLCFLTPANVQAFGTINGAGQRSEHERITRAALACAPGTKSDGSCFEPRSLDQLAGHTGTFGAVGSPDLDEFFGVFQHCDDADFLDVPGYPQTRAAANANLLGCVNHLRMRFRQGIDGAERLFDSDGELKGPEVDLTSDCTFAGGVAGRAKCNAIEGLGRALHGAQDFYSHSNWADEADPSRPIGITNPKGLNLPGPSPILDLVGTGTPAIPPDLVTGFYPGVFTDTCPRAGRITHACLNKDKVLIDPVSGATSDPQTPRGRVGTNAAKAVAGAIAETRRQWADFRQALVTRYGAELGKRMALAIAQDVPKVDLVFSIDTTGSMGPHIAGAVAAANDVVDALSGRGDPEMLTDYRVGVVDYKDVDSDPAFGCPPDYDAVTDLPFSTRRTEIVAALNVVRGKVSGGCDFPEDVLSGVQRAVGFPWRDGVNKAIIVMGDAPGHDPEPHSGLTSASVVAAALAVDPAIIYPILVGPFGGFGTDAFMANLAAGTGGRTFDGRAGGVAPALLSAITTISTSTPPPIGDTTPPEITVSGVTDGASFGDSQSPALGITASDADSGVASLVAQLDGEPVSSGPLSLDALELGTHTLVVQAIDNAGVSNVTALGFDVTTSTTDLKALVARYVADPQRRQTLLDQLLNVEKAVANGSNANAIRKLEGFHDWIATQKWAQTDLTSAQRGVLTRDAEAVIASLR
jgi:hypothetical protein